MQRLSERGASWDANSQLPLVVLTEHGRNCFALPDTGNQLLLQRLLLSTAFLPLLALLFGAAFAGAHEAEALEHVLAPALHRARAARRVACAAPLR